MIVPFAVPVDGELVNLSQIVRYVIHQPGACHDCTDSELRLKPIIHIVGDPPNACTVYFSDGSTRVYKDAAFQIINNEVGWLFMNYRSLQTEIESTIVKADRNAGGLIL